MNKKMSAFVWLSVSYNNKALIGMLETNRREKYNSLHDNEEGKKQAKEKDLFIDGKMGHYMAVLQTAANILLLGLLVVGPTALLNTYLYKKLKAYYETLETQGGEQWLQTLVSHNKIMIHNLILDLNQFLYAVYLATVCNSRLTCMLQAGQRIPAKEVVPYAASACGQVMTNLCLAVMGQDFYYRQKGTIFNWFKKSDRNTDSKKAGTNNTTTTGPQAGTGSNPNKSNRSEFLEEKKKELKAKGIFKCTLKPLMHLPHAFKCFGGKNLCTNYCTKGFFCVNDKSCCHRAHVDDMSEIAKNERYIVYDWEKVTTNMAMRARQEDRKTGKGKKN